MRRALIAPLLVSLALVISACDGDDNEDPPATPSGSASPAATVPAATPTASGPTALPAAITIEEPADDASVTVPFVAAGTANVFEGALMVDLLDPAGGLLCSRPVQATSGTGTPGTWETTIAVNPPAMAAGATLRAYSLSAQDGSVQDVVEREITVAPDQPNIVIESPECNVEVSAGGTLAVSGSALVFEAALTVQIREYFSGTVVLTQNTMSANGTERSPWSTTLALGSTPPGPYELVALSFSARDGSPENIFSIPLTVVP